MIHHISARRDIYNIVKTGGAATAEPGFGRPVRLIARVVHLQYA
jgi:hypothetical protein